MDRDDRERLGRDRGRPERGVEDLDRLAERWRTAPDGTRRFVPSFDPDSGGVEARILLLMQSPARSTVAAGARAVCSEDNPGPTASALRRAREEAGVPRGLCLRWNVVPWALEGRPGRADLEEGRLALGELIRALPGLRAVVAFGDPALQGVMRHLTLAEDAEPLPVLGVPHLSPANGHHRAEQHVRAVRALRLAHRAAS
ncbi:uracil-DNA glycosylase [Rothia sp. AR01]|uniref:Uracil-DNA glycosylase n=1 Tax=Rothia santali TaxID=2949643 RepID=A0A9X2HEE9_9MICC|nr:uracil-DNA glycosylase family protein [Rothia santali]MCP3425312.1 uracil-DNA glycosylase [Rothia santali]